MDGDMSWRWYCVGPLLVCVIFVIVTLSSWLCIFFSNDLLNPTLLGCSEGGEREREREKLKQVYPKKKEERVVVH